MFLYRLQIATLLCLGLLPCLFAQLLINLFRTLDYTYFGLKVNKLTCYFQKHVLADAIKAILSSAQPTSQSLILTHTSEPSFFFKAGGNHPLCLRKLLVHNNTPFLKRYGAIWVYHFARYYRATLQCTKADAQLPRTLTIEGIGLLRNVIGCRIASPELHTFPELHGATHARLDPPIFYLPGNISVLNHEL